MFVAVSYLFHLISLPQRELCLYLISSLHCTVGKGVGGDCEGEGGVGWEEGGGHQRAGFINSNSNLIYKLVRRFYIDFFLYSYLYLQRYFFVSGWVGKEKGCLCNQLSHLLFLPQHKVLKFFLIIYICLALLLFKSSLNSIWKIKLLLSQHQVLKLILISTEE